MDTQNFQHALNWILAAEGGYVHDPDDAGGETHFGISKRSYPALNIKTLTRAQAVDIYRKDFWRRYRLDELPLPVALVVFDTAVNSGAYYATVFLQQAVGARADGILGDKTIVATLARDPRWIVSEYLGRRALYCHDIVLANSSQARFLRGWFNRLFDLQTYIHKVTA